MWGSKIGLWRVRKIGWNKFILSTCDHIENTLDTFVNYYGNIVSINGCWQPSTFWRGCWKWTRIKGSQQRRPWLTRTWPRYILIVLKLLSSQFSFETNLSFSSQEIYFIFNLFFSPICLLIFHVYHQYADPTDEPNSQVYDQTFEDYELSIQDWKGENSQTFFNKNT